MTSLLKFSQSNSKTDRIREYIPDIKKNQVFTFSLPAGYTCPSALDCLSKFNPKTHKIEDGRDMKFRCFAAMDEKYQNVRDIRWHNFNLLRGKSTQEMTDLILKSLPVTTRIVRVHVSGDLFNKAYFLAWINVAKARPEIIFYGYTKQIQLWIELFDQIPDNFRLTASYGGRYDNLISEHGLKSSTVVYTEQDAENLGLPIDDNEFYAIMQSGSFALLIHGAQPAGSDASKASYANQKAGHAYSKTINKSR